jgi:hypothetical protein
MANSTTTLASIVAYAKTFPDLADILQSPSAGQSLQPALTIANDVMIEMIQQNFNWKWNRMAAGTQFPAFYTNGFQQDYAIPGLVNLGWIEHGELIDINNTAIPKPIWPLEVVRDLPFTSTMFGRPGQVCWLPNDQLYYATWGATNTGNATIGLNPGPNMVIGPLLGVYAAPINPILQVQDSFGNLWVVTTFGTTGSSNPFSTNLNPVYPTAQNPTQTATTVTDGTVVWTAVNPKGMGIRCNPIPPQTGIVYQFFLTGQYRAFSFTNQGTFQGGPFTSLNQTIEPIPDDFAKYFRDGFIALAYAHSPDARKRAKYLDMYNNWMKSLTNSRQQVDRERENAGFYPATSIIQQPYSVYPGPAYPFPLPY